MAVEVGEETAPESVPAVEVQPTQEDGQGMSFKAIRSSLVCMRSNVCGVRPVVDPEFELLQQVSDSTTACAGFQR
jgi:hypothetical protein